MGQVYWSITVSIDPHDTDNLPFTGLKALFDMASTPIRANIKPMKVQFWKNDSAKDAIATLSFEGWIASMAITPGDGVNHEMNLRLVPKLKKEP